MESTPNPYSAPAAPYEPPRRGDGLGFDYVDQHGRVLIVTILLAGFMLAHLASIGSNLMELSFLDDARRGLVTEADGESNDTRQLGVVILTGVTFFSCVIGIAMFLHRANKNARTLAGDGVPLEFTPGWTVGWFFVPLLNLWKPYSAVSEMFTVSQPYKPGWLGIWWAAWIAMNLMGNVSQRLSSNATEVDDFELANHVDSAHSLVAVLSAMAALWMVRTLHDCQHRHHQTGKPMMPGDG